MKILFDVNLHVILQEIYRLVHHASFTPEYVESLCPLERSLYWAYWEQEQKEQTKEPGQYNVMDGDIPDAINMQGLR